MNEVKYEDYLEGTGRKLNKPVDKIDGVISEETGVLLQAPIFNKEKMLESFPKDLFKGMDDTLKKTLNLNPTAYFEGKKKGIAFFPNFKTNPYQHLFYSEVNRQKGFNVFGFPSKKFSKKTINALKDKCNIIHLHWLHRFFDFRDKAVFLNFIDTVIHAKRNGFKIIWTVHNLISHESQDQDYEISVRSRFSKFCDKIIVHSEYAKKMVCERYRVNPDIIAVVPHGHYADHYPNKIGKSESRKKLGLMICLKFLRI